MPEELFIRMLTYLNWLFADDGFDENGMLRKRNRSFHGLPWTGRCPYFNRREQTIMLQFIRNVKVNQVPLFLKIKKPFDIKCFYNTFAPVQSVLIQHYETLTRTKFDRRKLINDVQHFGR